MLDKSRRQVSVEEGMEFAKKNNIYFMETSAKTGHNVDEVSFIWLNKSLKGIQSISI
jgi:hypothetical protein